MLDRTTELSMLLRQSLSVIAEQANSGLSAIEDKDDSALLGALGEMDSAMINIRNLIIVRMSGRA